LFDNGSILIDPGAWISHKHADHHAGLIDILIKRDQVCEVFYDQYKFFYNCDQNLAIKKGSFYNIRSLSCSASNGSLQPHFSQRQNVVPDLKKSHHQASITFD